MKNLNILVLALVFGLTLAACDNATTSGGEERSPVTYSGTSGGATYTLTISPPGSRAVLSGDDYELTITQTGGTKRSTGKVKSVSQNTFTLQPAVVGSPGFTVATGDTDITGYCTVTASYRHTTPEGGTIDSGRRKGDTWTFTIVDSNTISHNGKTYRK